MYSGQVTTVNVTNVASAAMALGFRVGEVVDVEKFPEAWYTAEIKEIRTTDNKLLVHYDGWSTRSARKRSLVCGFQILPGGRWDEWVATAKARKKPGYELTAQPVSEKTT